MQVFISLKIPILGNIPLYQTYLASLFLAKKMAPRTNKNKIKDKELMKGRPNLSSTSFKGLCIWPSAATVFFTSVGH